MSGEPWAATSPTERSNPGTVDIDRLASLDVLRAINAQDRTVPAAVAAALPQLARVVDLAVGSLRAGGRVHYVGAGTSGRLAVLDAAELAPTFGLPEQQVVAHLAGGDRALREAMAGAEDDRDAGATEMRRSVAAGDVVIGLAASGRTPYVLGALAAARKTGAHTALVSSNPGAPASGDVEVAVTVDTGPEAIAGSTRMKAGTAQKLVLTSFSTAVMVRLGYTYSNLMVGVHATNAKLRERTVRILVEATGLPEPECVAALADAGDDLKVALVQLLSGVDAARAAAALTETDGHVRAACERLSRPDP